MPTQTFYAVFMIFYAVLYDFMLARSPAVSCYAAKFEKVLRADPET